MQTKSIIKIDNIHPHFKTLSIAIDFYLADDKGNLISNEDNEPIKMRAKNRCGFGPGQLAEVEKYLKRSAPDADKEEVLKILNVLWSADIIKQYEQSLKDNGI